MSREIASGTPNRSPGYVQPGRRSPFLRISLVVAIVVAAALPVLYLAGQRRFASPGPVATNHASVESNCAQCHDVGKAVADLRCERCHDPAGADRFTHQAHVLLGSANSRKASAAPAMACATCHTDHRGRTFDIRGVDDRECGQCHLFSSLGRHPEFAAVKAQVSTGIGLSFGHERHIAEAAKQLGKKCEACHEATSDLTAFQPLNFDRHCAACHTKNGAVTGDTDPVSADLLVMAAAAGGAPPSSQPAELGRIVLSGMKHRDPWVLFNAQRLRRMIDADGVNAEASALRLQIGYFTQQLGAQPLGNLGRASLESWRTGLESEIAALDTRIAAPAGSGSDIAALKEIGDVIRQVARQLPQGDRGGLDAVAASNPGAPAPNGGPQAAQLLDARRKELLAALDAITERGDKGLSDRAAALRKQVEQLQASSGDPDLAALGDRLRSLDDIFGAVRATADPQAAESASQLGVLRDLAQSQVNSGVSPDDFEARRRELLAALDAIERSGIPAVTTRAELLRQRVLALRPGTYGDSGLRDERARKAKLLARVQLELQLTASGQVATPAAVPGDSAEEVRRMVSEARARLALLESGGRPGAAETPAEIRKATTTLSNLLGPCLKCHVMAGAKMAPVAAADVVFQHARFDHKPHVEQANCAACHKAVETSIRATDVNEPNVESCTACHKPSKSRSDCATCHVYHPPSIVRLVRSL
jgi:hypothetical protein